MVERNKRISGAFVVMLTLVVLGSVGVGGVSSGVAGEDKNLEFKTERGSATIVPLEHATFVLQWNGNLVFFDHVGGAGKF